MPGTRDSGIIPAQTHKVAADQGKGIECALN